MTENVLLIAFDGLDKELIDEFSLDSIKQSEYGEIDNSTRMESIKTSELFASLITGETPEIHGITGLGEIPKWKKKIHNFLSRDLLLNRKGGNRLRQIFEAAVDYNVEYYTRDSLRVSTLFRKINNSKPMFIPSYNPSIFWKKEALGVSFASYDDEDNELGYYWDNFEYERRKRNLFRPVNKWFSFLACHFHRPDAYHHIYVDQDLTEHNKGKIKKLYLETDDLAQEIIEYFQDDYEYIIFMSDHGLPTEDAHNENAFYSCNKELFGDEIPHITDFHDKILELTGNEDKIKSS